MYERDKKAEKINAQTMIMYKMHKKPALQNGYKTKNIKCLKKDKIIFYGHFA